MPSDNSLPMDIIIKAVINFKGLVFTPAVVMREFGICIPIRNLEDLYTDMG